MWLNEMLYMKAMFSDTSAASIEKLNLRSVCIAEVYILNFDIFSSNCFLIVEETHSSLGNHILS